MSLTEDVTSNGVNLRELAHVSVSWRRIFATIGIFAALAVVFALYYIRTFSGLTERDQIDIAQVARSVASGGGFTTRFIRPFNASLMSQAIAPLPEVNHGPLYPYAVAAMFRIIGPSEQLVVWVSAAFMYLTILGTYLLGKALFDWRTGIFSAVILGVSASAIRVGVGASEWPMAAFWFVLLLLTIASHHKRASHAGRAGILCPIAAAILVAALYMTNHVLIFLAIPIAVYFAVTGKRRRLHVVVFAIAVTVAAGPWAYRNVVHTSGSILGANAWDIMVDTKGFPGDTFYRSTDMSDGGIARVVLFPLENFPAFSKKLMDGTSETVHDIVSMLGLVMLPFAVVSAFYRFKTPTGNAVRGLLYGVAPVLCLSIALFSLGSSAIILVAPAVAVFGCAYFFLLLDAKKLHPVYWRGILIGAILLVSWPALVAITWDRNDRENQMSDVTRLMVNGDALGITCMYTDVPWISAWRTLRVVAVWIPRSDDDISKLGIEGLPMNAVILTAESRKLDPDETWYRLATMELQRDFVANPDEVLERVRDYGNELGRSPEEVKTMKSFFRQDQRNANVYDSLIGFRQADLGPFASDDLRVFERKSE